MVILQNIEQLFSFVYILILMKNIIKKNRKFSFYFLVVALFITTPMYSQLDSLLFYKEFHGQRARNVIGVGDQNLDGCNDILIYDCQSLDISIYFGGSPMDTIPDVQLEIPELYIPYDFAVIDLNDDGHRDIVVSYVDSIYADFIRIFYGGNLLDGTSDIIFRAPSGSYQFGGDLFVTRDFNGDGREELVVYDTNPPNVPEQYGIFYFYNTGATFDTSDYKTLTLYPADSVKLRGFTTGDLNGDGKADISLHYYGGTPFIHYRSFIAGNADWNFEPVTVFRSDINSFSVESFQIIRDLNGDGKDDILLQSYGDAYPYYYRNSILYGELPVDTVLDLGLNTQNLAIITENAVSPGDINGDGYNDLLCQVVTFGAAWVKLWVGGKTMPELPKKVWYGRNAPYEMFMGELVTWVGDIDGDGVDDICYGEVPPSSCEESLLYIFRGDTSVVGDTTTFLEESRTSIPEGYYIGNPYPNPFNPTTVIEYSIKSDSKILVELYDMIGTKIKTLFEGPQTSGFHRIKIDGSGLPSGVYFCRFQFWDKKGRRTYLQGKKLLMLK
ncbi:MAG: hypothetical protein SCALA702_02030 [Melioribacteraceae bacterium]|nr:MAG: hypothetical protein SCALA702_02030 [Melioribacteraceae bacterium]